MVTDRMRANRNSDKMEMLMLILNLFLDGFVPMLDGVIAPTHLANSDLQLGCFPGSKTSSEVLGFSHFLCCLFTSFAFPNVQ